jgi:uncharacterized protein
MRQELLKPDFCNVHRRRYGTIVRGVNCLAGVRFRGAAARFIQGTYDMGTEQYHEPAGELSQKTRTFARMITGLIEEAEAIGWYEQRLSLEKDADARAIMKNAQKEEFKHFSMDLEFLLRRQPEWRMILKGIVLVDGNIVKNAGKAEKAAE